MKRTRILTPWALVALLATGALARMPDYSGVASSLADYRDQVSMFFDDANSAAYGFAGMVANCDADDPGDLDCTTAEAKRRQMAMAVENAEEFLTIGRAEWEEALGEIDAQLATPGISPELRTHLEGQRASVNAAFQGLHAIYEQTRDVWVAANRPTTPVVEQSLVEEEEQLQDAAIQQAGVAADIVAEQGVSAADALAQARERLAAAAAARLAALDASARALGARAENAGLSWDALLARAQELQEERERAEAAERAIAAAAAANAAGNPTAAIQPVHLLEAGALVSPGLGEQLDLAHTPAERVGERLQMPAVIGGALAPDALPQVGGPAPPPAPGPSALDVALRGAGAIECQGGAGSVFGLGVECARRGELGPNAGVGLTPEAVLTSALGESNVLGGEATIMRGDTLGEIALAIRRQMGDTDLPLWGTGGLVDLLAASSGVEDPNLIHPEQGVRVPTQECLAEAARVGGAGARDALARCEALVRIQGVPEELQASTRLARERLAALEETTPLTDAQRQEILADALSTSYHHANEFDGMGAPEDRITSDAWIANQLARFGGQDEALIRSVAADAEAWNYTDGQRMAMLNRRLAEAHPVEAVQAHAGEAAPPPVDLDKDGPQ